MKLSQIFMILVLSILLGCQASGGGGGSGGGILTPTTNYTTTISATTNHTADNVDTSIVTITVLDGALPVVGVIPTFTVSGSNNFITACSATDATGASTCGLRSTKAEVKTLKVNSPNPSTTATMNFLAGAVGSASTINSLGPATSDGVSSMTISIALKDNFGNAVSGIVPTFDATPGAGNTYGVCTASTASGVSTCSMQSSVAGIRTLRLTAPVAISGGPAFFFAGPADPANSSIAGTTPHSADGVDASTITIVLRDATMNPALGVVPVFTATGTGNIISACSSTNATGTSTCTLKSTDAGIKTLSLSSPFTKAGNDVTFTVSVGAPVAANSTITGTTLVTADSVSTSTITITLRDAGYNPVPGITPTFAATDTGATNTYGVCSATDAGGTSTCTLSSTKAETKTLAITNPVVKPDGNVTFIAGAPSAASTTITGTSPTVADGSTTSTITVTVLDAFGNPVAGETPTFTATDTGTSNVYGACSVTNISGASTCTLSSTVAEVKTLSVLTPVSVVGGTVTFIADVAVAANSTITGTSPAIADGSDASTVTIILKDVNNNPVVGTTPTFTATDTGTTNVYGACSATDASGVSTCTLKSLSAETKTLSIATPLVKSDGTVVFTPAGANAANSSITGTGPVVADGVANSTITVTLKDINNNPVVGEVPTFSATDTGATNANGVCSATNGSGVATCTLSSTKAETKTLSITAPVTKTDGTVTFTAGAPAAAASTITGTSPTVADGTSTATVTVTIHDAFNNPIAGVTPTYTATDTGATNSYGPCTVTDASGASTCTLSSTVAETKTLSIATPVAKTDGTVTFTAGPAVAATSTITGTGPVIADGVDASTVTMTFNDAYNNPVSGITPSFSATDTGGTNTYGACSVSDASGASTCTLTSTVAEDKTLSITSPFGKADGTVTFVPAGASVANSTITGSSPVVADGAASSTVTITLKDANNNPVVGEVPTFSATDTGTTNAYGSCSATDSSGVSTCTLTSTVAEVKTLSIATPVVKAGGSVTFVAGAPVAATSTITGSSPVIADGASTSTVIVTLKDAFSNPVSGETPTFSATDTGSTNSYGACSTSDTSGVSTCSLSTTKAETKTLSITAPVSKADGTVTFTAGPAVAANSSITGTGPVAADGASTSIITVVLQDANANPVMGTTPIFSATDSGNGNTYGACSATDATGTSTCTLSSTYAQTKTLSLVSPISKADGTVDFVAGSAVAANSSITGTSPVAADGSSSSTIVITLRDASNNPVSGVTPTFSATDTGSTNSYGACSSTNASGISTCTLTSTKAETKTLSISTPVVKADGTVVFTPGLANASTSTITGTSPVAADGTSTSTITVTLLDAFGNAVSGETPTFTATDTGSTNVYGACSASDSSGVSTCTLSSLKAQTKTLSITSPVFKSDGNVVFTAGAAVAANSTITGTGPVAADGTSTSAITISLFDANLNPVEGQTPTFTATDTGSGNTYGACSVTNASGIATCTLSSTVAETKTLSIATPVVKVDGTVIFTAGSAVAANSSISGTGPVIANGSATSTVTITLNDASNNPVSGVTPTFTATDTGSGNTYGACSATDASGISTCTLKSTKAEIKTLSIASPVVKADGTVTFNAGAAVAANSSITGTGPVVADGTDASTVTVTLRDANNNGVSGQTPTFSATNTGSTNVYGACTLSDTSGISTCSLKSTKAQVKTLSITAPVSKAGSTVTFIAGSPSNTTTTITGTTPVSADGVSQSIINITILDAYSNPISGTTPIFNATDTDTTNVYGACVASDSSGLSLCTLASTKAEFKTLQLTSPVAVTGDVVEFSAALPTAANSTISGTSPVLANGTTDSTITITLRDASNNPVAGIVPTFDATNTGSGNSYDECSMSDAGGVSTCTMQSTVAESKTLRITAPVTKTGSSVVFTAGPPVAGTSTITGTGPVTADGSSTSTVSITLKDAFGNTVSGQTPAFTATDTGTTNVYGACSSTDTAGVATCTLASLKAETKTLSITAPVSKAGGTVVFSAGTPVAANSTITGTGPTNPDGISESTITINLQDINSNPVSGVTPTFNATGSNNTYGACSASDTSGNSTCTLASTTAETKTLSITSPFVKADGTVIFATGSPTVANSSVSASGPVTADGVDTSTVTITLHDSADDPVVGITPTFSATGSGNTIGSCSATDLSGISTCILTSTKAETKTVSIASPIIKTGNMVDFTPGPVSAANSTIECDAATYKADGSDTCTITVTLRDAFDNAIEGEDPLISVTGTSNTVSACSTTDFAGTSTCTLSSTKAEGKFLSITSPVSVSNPTEYAFNPDGINIQVPIEMFMRGSLSGTSAINWERSRTTIDPEDYVAENNDYYFEIVADNTNTSNAYQVQLINGANTVISDSTITVPASSTARRFRVAFTPSATLDNYRVRTSGTASNNQLRIHTARIVIEQTKATATKIYFPLVGWDQSGEHKNNSSNNNSASATTTSTSFNVSNASYYYSFSRNDANYDAIPATNSWTLDVTLSSSNAAGTATAALFNKTTNQQVTAATVTQTGNSVAHRSVNFDGDATNFTDGSDFELRIKSSSGSYTTRIYKAGLWVKLKYLKKTLVGWRLITRRSATSSAVLPDGRFHYDAGAWSNPTTYFATFGNTATSAIQLYDVGNSDTTSTGSSISSITQPASYGLSTTAVSLTDDHRYIINHSVSSGTGVMGSAFVFILAHD